MLAQELEVQMSPIGPPPDSTHWYQISVGTLCAGIRVQGGIVTMTAPCFRWMRGKDFGYTVRGWVESKNGSIERLDGPPKEGHSREYNMTVELLPCPCEAWQKYVPMIDGCIAISALHGAPYEGEPFKICPWCGTERQPKDPEWKRREDIAAEEALKDVPGDDNLPIKPYDGDATYPAAPREDTEAEIDELTSE